MTDLLTELLHAGLIENLNGDDDRFSKIERAAQTVAQELREQPSQIIRAILAGLDADIPENDSILAQAHKALVAEWKAVRSVHTDMPVNLLRAILLDACNQVAKEDNNAAILWLTAADTLPLLQLGREETAIRKMLAEWAKCAEEKALAGLTLSADDTEQATIGEIQAIETPEFEAYEVNQDTLLEKIEAAVGPSNIRGETLSDSNPYWSNQQTHWSHQFAPRMQQLLVSELDSLGASLFETNQQVQVYLTKLTKTVNNSLSSQQRWVHQTQQAEQIRLNALWWSEALYSSSLQRSYRELDPVIASIVMAIDLLNTIAKPTPASVSYLLAEAVNRLPEASFNQKHTLQELFSLLSEARNSLSKEWLKPLTAPPETGRLSLRDAVILVLTDKAQDIEEALTRTGASNEFELSFPQFAQALFRQEQAVQLAGEPHE